MKNRILAALGVVAVMTTSVLLTASEAYAGSLRIAVASNFKPVAQELANRFSAATGHQIMLSSASTGILFNQLAYGAPFDLFLSADSERPHKLFEQGLLAEEPKPYAYGRLVFWQPGNPEPDYKTIQKWQGRLAMANPGTAPYGLAAKQVMEFFQLWGDGNIQPLQGANIQQAWQFVATGNAQGGFVALSQIRSDKISQDYLLLRDELYNPIRQELAILKSGDVSLARYFVQFMLEPSQQELIQASGYYPVIQPRQQKTRTESSTLDDESGGDKHSVTPVPFDPTKVAM